MTTFDERIRTFEMLTANRFAALVKSPKSVIVTDAKSSSTSVDEEKSQAKTLEKSKSVKKTIFVVGQRSYEEDIREKENEYKQKQTDAFAILADKEKLGETLRKSKMCRSVESGQECRHGMTCRFAHSVDELTLSDCFFGERCIFVRIVKGKLLNSGGKLCCHKHPQEDKNYFLRRTGYIQPQPSSQMPDKSQVLAKDEMHSLLDHIVKEAPTQPPLPTQPPPQRQTQMPTQPPLPTQPPPPRQTQMPTQPPLPTQPPPPRQTQLPTQPQAPIYFQQFGYQHPSYFQPPELIKPFDQILIIRVPRELASQAIEIAMKNGKTRIQVEIIE